MNILITGGAGFVGSYLAGAELRNGHSVTVYDLASPQKVSHLLGNPRFSYKQGDILDRASITPLIQDADLIYHYAAIADPALYCFDPLRVLQVDLEGTQLVLSLAFQYKKKVSFASTSEVYGKNLRVPWAEDDERVLGSTRMHRWSYSSSKAVGEHYCFAYAQKGLRMVICRFFNFYGPRLDFLGTGRVMTCFLDKFMKGEPVEVVEPGDQTRCFTYIDDGIEGILKATHLPQGEGQVFNLGSTKETTMLELASLMKRVGGFTSEIVVVPAAKKYGEGYEDVFRRVPNCGKAREVLGWEARCSLEDGLRKTIEYYRQER